MLTTEVTKVPFLATDPPPLYLPCSGRVDHWEKVAGFPSMYSQLITAEFSTNYLMVRYSNIKIYATEVKYRFLLLTRVVTCKINNTKYIHNKILHII